MKILIASCAIAATLATPAFSLSCIRPDVARTFNWAAEATEAYVVLYGDFTYPTPPSSDTGDINAPREVQVNASFEGQTLTPQGFRTAVPLEMTVRLECFGPWCGSLPQNGEGMLAFVEQTPDGYVLTVDPCGGNLFANVTRGDVETVEACMRGDSCGEAPLR